MPHFLFESTLWFAATSGLLWVVGTTDLSLNRTSHQLFHLIHLLLGGCLLALGLAVARGYSYSQSIRPANKQLDRKGLLLGVSFGILCGWAYWTNTFGTVLPPNAGSWRVADVGASWHVAPLVVWAGWRAWQISRISLSRTYTSEVQSVLWPDHHHQLLAAMLGLAAGVLYRATGHMDQWSFTALMPWSYSEVRKLPMGLGAGLSLGIFFGGAVYRRSKVRAAHRLLRGAEVQWEQGFAGTAVGMGVALVCGGVISLLHSSLPSTAAFALVALASMLLAIAVTRQLPVRDKEEDLQGALCRGSSGTVLQLGPRPSHDCDPCERVRQRTAH
jgi:hypothetical protein